MSYSRYFDPDQGRRRRKLLLNQLNSFMSQSDDAIGKTARDLSNRTRGMLAETSAQLTEGTPDDVILVERVRSAMAWSHIPARSTSPRTRDA